jgi:hypothetical protein
MSESDYSRKYALECMRMAADCMQLAGDVQNPASQSHFVRIARTWSELAVRGPNSDTWTEQRTPRKTRNRRSLTSVARTSQQ